MKILICDNDIEQVNLLMDMCKMSVLEHDWDVEIEGTTDSTSIELHEPDVLILDIEMPGETGLEIKERLSKHGEKPYIIFATDYEEYMSQAFNRNVIGYMLKPVKKNIMDTMLCKALELHGNDALILLENDQVVSTKEIVSIVSQSGYSNIYLVDGKIYPNLKKTLKQWEAELTKYGLIRISDNTLVSCRYIKNFGKTEIEISYGEGQAKTHKISRRRRNQAYEKYREYCIRMATFA